MIKSPTKVLVCGGAGYIGSHAVWELRSSPEYEVVIVDDMSKGHRESVPEGVPLEIGNIADGKFMDAVFQKHKPDAVMHFAASISVGDSVADPLAYFENNVSATVSLLQAMVRANVKYIIFSSTAALFGDPTSIPISSDDRKIPMSPYGDTKMTVETILKWSDQAYGLKYVCLRYFNACGAHESGKIGEHHEPETHLIPLILEVPMGKRAQITIFGDDYPTDDGTCIRDYIHVSDLASAHVKALEYLQKGNSSNWFNLGSGKGYSVKEIVDAARKVTGHPIPAVTKERRPGDPPILIAESEKAEKTLGWVRKYNTIEDIVATAWRWHQTHSKGYASA